MFMSEVNHQSIKTNGINIHVAEQGTGPLVLLLHGFPEIWYSWRHQLNYLAQNGYHAVAPDLRGYGDSDSPINSDSYTLHHIVGDLIGLLDHFGEHKAYVVGSDWGANIGWHLSLSRPDRVKGFVALGVPYFPRSPTDKTVETIRKVYGDGAHVCQFQEPGRAERAFARYDCLTVMKKFLLITWTHFITAPPGMEIVDFLPTPSVLPSWITEEELMVFADKFQESGFTGAFNYYRAMDLSWELLAPWQGSKITVPTKFIAGDKDVGFQNGGTKDFVEGGIFKSLVPNLEVVILDGHHHIHQEKAQIVSEEILSFIRKLSLD
uniref:soluble epoxide hydrolase n=1 Tax=Medicago truncatula TaxID=3880 RepID=I3T1V4_MEDTR|nr:unknown [Medicago truncatula]